MMDVAGAKAYCISKGIAFLEEVPMKRYTTFRIGGNVALFLIPKSVEEISSLMQKFFGQFPLFILGKGSNLLVSDSGMEGAVIFLGKDFSKVELVDEETIVCEAGAPLAKACYTAYKNGLSGLEFGWGIPGTVGGAAYMNAGAYGGECKDVVLYTEHIDEKGQLHRLYSEQLNYSYRHSAYSGKNLCIVRVAFRLKKGDPAAIRARMDELLFRRKDKQPLEYPSGGSTFKRPEGAFAAALIEQCGLKGKRVGGAMVSAKHSGFLINYQDATCQDVNRLITEVQEIVKTETGYSLECEIMRVGKKAVPDEMERE